MSRLRMTSFSRRLKNLWGWTSRTRNKLPLRTAVDARFTLACQTDLCSTIDACRDFHRLADLPPLQTRGRGTSGRAK